MFSHLPPSYPDSIRAARITVGDVSDNYCDYLYQRDVAATGKFCAGGAVDACQVSSVMTNKSISTVDSV